MMNWYRKAQEREYPVAAAVVAAGKVFTGRHHGEALEKAMEADRALFNFSSFLYQREMAGRFLQEKQLSK